MPSFRHDVIVELFRAAPELAALLARALGAALPDGPASLASIDLSQAAPATFLADVVVRVGSDAAVVVEVQLRPDPAKLLVWPVYITVARRQLACPVYLIIVCPDERVARWCRQPIAVGHPGFVLAPLVVGPTAIPQVTDAAQARRLPELAVLSVLAHGAGAAAVDLGIAAIQAVATVAPDRQDLYLDLVLASLNEAARRTLESTMIENYEFQSDFFRRLIARRLEEARAKALEEGRTKGLAEGLRASLVQIATAKLGALSPELTARIQETHDESVLRKALVDLALAPNADAVRDCLARLG